ncbi:MAG: M28 family peptidase [Terriglobia bacterium]
MKFSAARVTAMLLPLQICLWSQTVTVGNRPASLLESRLRQAPLDNHARGEAIFSLFAAAGCEPAYLEARKMKHGKWSNIVCTLPGKADEGAVPAEIVVGAHFDHVSIGAGIIDNWGGAAMLPALFESLKIQPRRHTFVFVAFAEEETGLNGSKDFAKSLSKEEHSSIRAMVNIDSVGAGTTAIWVSRADKDLTGAALGVGKALSIAVDGVNVGPGGESDSASFRDIKIPVIDFHSLHQDTIHIIHSRDDKMSALNMAAYEDTFRLISTFLGFIDQKLP